jgi:competence protein ComEC
MKNLYKINQALDYLLTQERQNLLHWLPVGLGIGIGAYFAMPTDPPSWVAIALVLTFAICSYLGQKLRVLFISLMVISIGFVLIQQRANHLATPMLHEPLPKPIKLIGRVMAIEQQENSMRLTLDDIQVLQLKKVRVVARGSLIPRETFYPGQFIQVRAMLMPPRRPVMAGAYDFRRKAYFDGIGAVGYVVAQPKLVGRASKSTWEERLATVRHQLTLLLRKAIPGQAGEIAAALVTGDRSGVTDKTRQQFADSGIAHILAISGLHLSIISGLAFLVVRGGLSFIPPVSLRFPIKKLAAIFAMVATTFYLFICGATIPAQRAKIQTTIILGAILIDRQAITMRNVALAATFILILLPESLISVSFQLSFAAVVALVAGYQIMQKHMSRWHSQDNSFLKRLMIYMLGISCSSVLATAATLPFTVFTFHKFSLTAVLTNLIAIPLVTFAIMPLLVLFLISVPLSLDGLISPLLKGAIEIMMALAAEVSTWSASLIQVSSISTTSLVVCVFGMLWLSLWSTKIRVWGVIPLGISLILPFFERPPDLYINEAGTFVAVRDSDGHAYVNTLQAGRFARKCWSESIAAAKVDKLSDRGKFQHAAYHVTTDQIMHLTASHYNVTVNLNAVEVRVTNKSGEVLNVITSQDLLDRGGHSIWFNQEDIKIKVVTEESKPWTLR